MTATRDLLRIENLSVGFPLYGGHIQAVQDASLAAAHAHAIKSSSGALGAMALYQAASELERACRQPQMALANQIHQQLPALIEQTQGRLQHHFQAVCRG